MLGRNLFKLEFVHVAVGVALLICLAAPVFAYQAMIQSAEAYLAEFKFAKQSILGTRIPCVGWADAGFTITYRLTEYGADNSARVCHKMLDDKWVLYSETSRKVVRKEHR